MDTQSLVGQLFMVDFTGPEPSPEITRLIHERRIGGVVLFGKNLQDPVQGAQLTNALQRLAANAGGPPLLLSVDQEGGAVTILPGTRFPNAMAFGATGTPELAGRAAAVTARELRAVGIHVNFAPVLDVNNNPANPVIGVRSYGDDPGRVAELGVLAVKGMQGAGVLATAKHFPGHGDTSLDSHLALPAVTHPRERLDAVELLPFRQAVRAGVAAVMTAHVVYAALDKEYPATLSPTIIGLLRKELKFKGLVISDSMRMRAVADRYAPGEAAVQAVRAGVDIVLALGPMAGIWEAIDEVRAAVAGGRIPAARIREAAKRVLAVKRRLGLFKRALVSESAVREDVGRAEDAALADSIAQAAATIVRDPNGLVPLRAQRAFIVADLAPRETVDRLAGALRAAGLQVEAAALDTSAPRPSGSPAEAFVVPIGGVPPEQWSRIREVTLKAARRGPAVAVATGVPYPLAAVPECAALAVYGSDPASLKAAAGVLAGRVRARGTLPVTLPATVQSAHVEWTQENRSVYDR